MLQDRALLRAPFVIVASSIGGMTAEMYARRCPERVAGLIFLDATSSFFLREILPLPRWAGAAAQLAAGAAHMGAVRLLDPFHLTGESEEMRRSRGFTYGARAINTLTAIVRGADRSNEEFATAPRLRADLPLVVLSASDPRAIDLPGLTDFSVRRSGSELRLLSHQELAKQSTRGVWKMVPQSGHLIAVTNPDAVTDEIFRMLDGFGEGPLRRTP